MPRHVLRFAGRQIMLPEVPAHLRNVRHTAPPSASPSVSRDRHARLRAVRCPPAMASDRSLVSGATSRPSIGPRHAPYGCYALAGLCVMAEAAGGRRGRRPVARITAVRRATVPRPWPGRMGTRSWERSRMGAMTA